MLQTRPCHSVSGSGKQREPWRGRGVVCPLSRQPISSLCWVLLLGVQYSSPGRTEKGFLSSNPPDSQQKCSTTSGSGFCASFVSRHRSRTQNGPGGNPTPCPHVSHCPCQSCRHRNEKRQAVSTENHRKHLTILYFYDIFIKQSYKPVVIFMYILLQQQYIIIKLLLDIVPSHCNL